jgi:Ca2+-binding RTX toxin-like protein
MTAPRASASAALVLGALLLAPAAASAGTVDYSSLNILQYTAAAGEANRLTISVEANRMVFTEGTGILIQATAGAQTDCDGEGTAVVKCKIDHAPATPVDAVGVSLADLDDRVTAAFPAGSKLGVSFNGGAGADELDAATSADSDLSGDAGADKLIAGRGRNQLIGGTENDEETAGPEGSFNTFENDSVPDGTDVLRGGAGIDIVSYQFRNGAISASADGVANDGEAGENDNITEAVEGIQTGEGDDTITASAVVGGSLSGYEGKDHLIGGPGDDLLLGGDGDDTLEGNAGDDTALPGDLLRPTSGGGARADAGADSFSGGPGFDTIDYSTRAAAVSVTLNSQPDDGAAGEGDNTGADVEGLIGGAGADTLAGDGDAERYDGGGGGDTISPGGGSDEVTAGAGDDTIGAQDSVFDRVACGIGTDTVTADFADALDGCENATVSPQPIVTPPDLTAPAILITKLKTKPKFKAFAAKGLVFKLGSGERASFVAELQGVARGATLARTYNLTLATRKLGLGSKVRTVKLKAKRSLLGKRRKLTLRLRVTAKDAAGNQKVTTRTIHVRR